MKFLKYLISIFLVLAIGCFIYLQQPAFITPEVTPQANSKHYADGYFKNPIDEPVTDTHENLLTILYKFLFQQNEGVRPDSPIPSKKTHLHQLSLEQNVIIWMGHSSYFMQLDGKKFLIDPVFSRNASPVPETNVAFDGSNIYNLEDIPNIDYLLITHDHWDHLDYPTISNLKDKVAQVVTPIGVGSYFRQWGFDAVKIFEGDWFSEYKQTGLSIHILPTQHFSGRLLERNKTLWGSFAVVTANNKIYFGSDSGYGPHFKKIEDKIGSVDIAILENGQYNQAWAHIHMLPEQAAQAAVDMKAKAVIPSHNSKFKLAHHTWNDPLERIYQASQGKDYRLMTPMIGEAVNIDDKQQNFKVWWR